MSEAYRIAAYNVGWNITDKKRSAGLFSEDLVGVWRERQFHAIGISEIFEVDYPAVRRAGADERRRGILAEFLNDLRQHVSAGWHGRQDDHCFYIWHESLNLIRSEFVSLGVSWQPWRKVQYLVFQPLDAK